MNKICKRAISGITHQIHLSDCHTIPSLGLGCWKLTPEQAYKSVKTALRCGYRLFDTATLYGNELAVGQALKESGLKRHEYFISTKLPPDQHGFKNVKQNFNESLKKLGMSYVDLYLIHSPTGGRNIETWTAFFELQRNGLTKSIGVCNYSLEHLKELTATGLPKPALNQIEFHPWCQQVEVYDFCLEHDIVLMGFCPLARTLLFESDTNLFLDKISKRYGKTKAQVVLRWALQKGVVTIPRSSSDVRIKENSLLYDFELTTKEMNEMTQMDENKYISTATNAMYEKWKG